jgi:hypothetical protein
MTMNDWTGVKKTIVPAALAVLIAVNLSGYSSASAHEAPAALAPAAIGGNHVDIDHSLHGAPSVVALARDCSGSALDEHDGFQEAPTCSDTAFGEIAAQANNPQLLIVKAPRVVKVGQPIVLKVSTRNLKRDRFLAAGQGGYYLETSLLNGDGITRGHFHSECRNLASQKEAPQPDRAGDGLFVATEDGGGSKVPDTITVTLPGGLQKTGVAQCAVWAGDGSHRIPMMQFANQVPAFDVVRVLVVGKAEAADDNNAAEEADGRGSQQKPDDGG